MKVFLKLSFVFLFLLLCGGKKQKILFISSISDPKTFNILLAQETSSTFPLGFLFEGLTETDGVTQEVKPALAERWEIKKDGLEYIFYLRKGVYWFDGVELTADDVAFTFNDLIYNPDIPNSAKDIFTIEGKKIQVVKLDKYKVKFILPKPFAPFLRALSVEILPKHRLYKAVEEGKFNQTWGIDTDPKQLIGTGPFMMVDYKPAERIVYVKNPKYWKFKGKERLPLIDKMIIYIVENQEVERMMFERCEIDILSIRAKDYSLLKKGEEKGRYKTYNCGPAFGTNFLTFNQNPNLKDKVKLRWFSDLSFRRAVAHVIDKQTIIRNVYHGLGFEQYSAMEAAAKFFHNPNVKKYPYSLEKAKKILKDAGYEDRDKDGIIEDKFGNEIRFSILTNAENTIRVDIGSIITKDLRNLGMDVRFSPVDFNSLVRRLTETFDWDCVLIGLTGGIEPHFGKNVWHTDGHLHFWRPKPPKNQFKSQEDYQKAKEKYKESIPQWEKEVDNIFDTAVSIIDKNKRKKYYDRWQELVAENLPLIYTVNQAALYAIKNRLKNTKPTAYGGVLHNIEEIDIK